MARGSTTSTDLTVAILTCNEEKRLAACLSSIPDCYPVIVVDSGSTDETVSLAESLGCQVFQNPWPGFSRQRNFTLEKCYIETKWVLFVDADEIFSDNFFKWFEKEKNRTDFDIGLVSSFLVFRGKLLRHAPGYPVYHPRLVRRGAAYFVENHTGHGEAVNIEAKLLNIDIPYIHNWFEGDWSAIMIKHVKLAALEVNIKKTSGAHLTLRGKLSLKIRHPLIRVPARFFYHYIFKGGILDGWQGLEYSLMYTWFEFTKGLMRFGDISRPAV